MSNIPEGYIPLDLIGFTDKGEYNSSSTYMTNDLVHINNNIWKCLSDNVINVIPSSTSGEWDIFIKAPQGQEVDKATNSSIGSVMGNEDEINIDENGKMHILSSFTPQNALSEIIGDEDKKKLFGKLAKTTAELIKHLKNEKAHANLYCQSEEPINVDSNTIWISMD